MKWFGFPYPSPDEPAPIYLLGQEVPTPVGRSCIACGSEIDQDSSGFILPYFGDEVEEAVYHRVCLVASIIPPRLLTELVVPKGGR